MLLISVLAETLSCLTLSSSLLPGIRGTASSWIRFSKSIFSSILSVYLANKFSLLFLIEVVKALVFSIKCLEAMNDLSETSHF